MIKLWFAFLDSYWDKNKIYLALAVGLGGLTSIAVISNFESVFINEAAYNLIHSPITPNISSTFNMSSTKWIILISIVSLLSVPMLYNSKNCVLTFLLAAFILTDSLAFLIMFVAQEINNGAVIFISISFMYFIFVLILLLRLICWLICKNKKG